MVAASFALTHAALECVATYAEVHLGAFLWKQQDALQLFSPHNYVNRGRGRLFIYGPSEAREAFLLEEIGPRVPGLRPYQQAQHGGTFEEGLVVLDYIERVYGKTAMPRAMLLGITVRFVANIRSEASPLFTAIDRYSPYVRLDDSERPPRLIERPLHESVRARLALLAFQPDRYRRGVFAVGSRALTHFVPTLAADRRVWGPVSQAKRLTARIGPEDRIKRWLATPGNEFEQIHAWDPQLNRMAIAREFHLLREYASRHAIDLYVVNLPELSWNRELYDPDKYAVYLSIVREALGDTPFLDLRTALADDEFYDWSHATWRGGRQVSRQVAAFIQDRRAPATETHDAHGVPVHREIE
jgi:hypothetical protein